MERPRADIYLVAGLLLVALVLYVSQATWLLTPPVTLKYIVQPGESLGDVADRFQVREQDILAASDLRPGVAIETGQVLTLPVSPLSPLRDWRVQWVGWVGTLLGVLVGLWLAHAAGMLPAGARGLVSGISLVLAFTGYATLQSSSGLVQTPLASLLLLNAVKDGLAWSLILAALSKVLSLR
jgi:LysM repeat protein